MNGQMEVQYSVEMRGGGRRDIGPKVLKITDNAGIWQFDIDLKSDLGIEGLKSAEQLTEMCKYLQICTRV